MAIDQTGIQAGTFETFYPTNIVYSVGRKYFFLGHTPQENGYFIYNVTDTGNIDNSKTLHKGKLSFYLSNLQYVQDSVQNKSYLYGYNLNDKTIQLYVVLDNGNIENVYNFKFNAAGMSIRTTSFYVINGVLFYYYQYEKSKEWELFTVKILGTA
ncbi:hypothetical protein [Providencia sneebia]|uniref:DUF5050 domain-containing protein n=1 Tax=Providencia sneebia DSM 19967 TaxID=1141660 RepID=K8W796_9GAMM|nr:hypothetical protein [Providencia sneebia]EKT55741.1 hypothetical protein OO7_12229 [Providencia sneebia DSM 19967]